MTISNIRYKDVSDHGRMVNDLRLMTRKQVGWEMGVLSQMTSLLILLPHSIPFPHPSNAVILTKSHQSAIDQSLMIIQHNTPGISCDTVEVAITIFVR